MTHESGAYSGARVAWPVGWVLGLLASAAALAAVYWFFVLTDPGQHIDDNALIGARDFLAQRDQAREPALAFLGKLPHVSAVMAAAALIISAVVHRSVLAPLITLAGLGSAVLATQLLKHQVLERPNLGISEATVNSFPSGHTTLAAASMAAVFCTVTPRWRPLVAWLGGLYAAAAGAATLVLGWHRPADIIGAYLVVLFFALLTGWVLTLAAPQWNQFTRRDFWAAARGFSWLTWVPGVAAMAIAAILWALLPPVDTGENYRLLLGFLAGGVLAIGGAALTTFALMERIFAFQGRVRGR